MMIYNSIISFQFTFFNFYNRYPLNGRPKLILQNVWLDVCLTYFKLSQTSEVSFKGSDVMKIILWSNSRTYFLYGHRIYLYIELDEFQTQRSSSAVLCRYCLKILQVSWPSISVCLLMICFSDLYRNMIRICNRFILVTFWLIFKILIVSSMFLYS